VRELLEAAVAKFNAKASSDAGLQKELEGVVRKILLDVKDGAKYHFVLENKRVDGVRDGPVEAPDITVSADEATLRALLTGEIGPMKAWATNRLRVKGSLDDVLRIRKFF
jgi:putative sterol carrier protein